MTHLQQQAHNMFVAQNKTQKEIAATLGIADKTLYNWIQRYGWHKERYSGQTMYAGFALSMGRQLSAYQHTIAQREEGEVPTAADVQLQCKLLGALLKLTKHGFHTADAIPDFVHYVIDKDADMGRLLTQYYTAYTQEGHSIPVSPDDEEVNEELVELPPPVVATTVPVTGERAPFSEHDFKQNKHLVKSLKDVPASHTTRFRGRFVNSRWLQYNLFQYCLPPQQRHFIGDARKLLAEVDHTTLQQQIAEHFTNLQTNAAA